MNVLEIDVKEIGFDRYEVCIKEQNYNILTRGKFIDKDLGVLSSSTPAYVFDNKNGILFVRGAKIEEDEKSIFVNTIDLQNIHRKVDAINAKYGISKEIKVLKVAEIEPEMIDINLTINQEQKTEVKNGKKTKKRK